MKVPNDVFVDRWVAQLHDHLYAWTPILESDEEIAVIDRGAESGRSAFSVRKRRGKAPVSFAKPIGSGHECQFVRIEQYQD